MPVHKIITGEGGETYLPFALSRLRHFKIIESGPTAQKYVFDDATVRVEWNPHNGQHFVRIDGKGGAQGYEFVTTADDLRNDPTRCWSTGVGLGPSGLQVTRIAKPDDTKPVPGTIRDPMSRAINRQRNAEYHWYPSDPGAAVTDQIRTKPYFMTSAAAANSWAVHAMDWQDRGGSFVGNGNFEAGDAYVFPSPVDSSVDTGVDIPPSLYEGGKAYSGAPWPLAPAWWRRAACMEVGGRRFIILSDAHSNFYAYPAGHMTSDKAQWLIPREACKLVRAADYMPPGVVVPTVATMVPMPRGFIELGGPFYQMKIYPYDPVPYDDLIASYGAENVEPGAVNKNQVQKHQYLWDFRGDGVRAAAVVHTNKNNGHAALTYSLFSNPEDPPIETAPLRALAEFGPQYRVRKSDEEDIGNSIWISAAGGLTQVDLTERAVLEVSFEISPLENGDFSFAVNVERLITGGWFFDAAYAYNDARLHALGVQGGDLLTDEVRLYRENPRITPLAYNDRFVVTRNQRSGQDVASFCSHTGGLNTAFENWHDVDKTYTYPGIAVALTVARWDYTYSATGGDRRSSALLASDLRSMSKVFRSFLNDEELGLHVVVFGEIRSDKGVSSRTEAHAQAAGQSFVTPAFKSPTTELLSYPHLPVTDQAWGYDIVAYRHWNSQGVSSHGFNPVVHTTITSHPDGHFAAFTHGYGAQDIFDLIEYRRVKKNEAGESQESFLRTTHLEALAKAHGLTIDMTTYRNSVYLWTPIVVQRFSSWRNVKVAAETASEEAALNPKFEVTP